MPFALRSSFFARHYPLSTIHYPLSAFCFLLSAFCFLRCTLRLRSRPQPICLRRVRRNAGDARPSHSPRLVPLPARHRPPRATRARRVHTHRLSRAQDAPPLAQPSGPPRRYRCDARSHLAGNARPQHARVAPSTAGCAAARPAARHAARAMHATRFTRFFRRTRHSIHRIFAPLPRMPVMFQTKSPRPGPHRRAKIRI